jgi:hypothetical protein
MSAGVRVASFGALLLAIFALALVGGRALDPATEAAEPESHATPSTGGRHGAPAGTAQAAGDGLRIVTQSPTTLTPGRRGRLAFRIADAHGATLRAFDTEQARRMHLIVVRRDLRRFQHLHPTQDQTGAWSVALTLPDAGVYQAYADFTTGAERHTLGVDLFAGGRFEPLALPDPEQVAHVDGYDVELRERNGGELTFTVRRAGHTVDDLQSYLGARGHLVMLRAGDLAYEHVHPGTSVVPATIVFEGGDTGPGTYRLFLQFRHGDRVHTAALTRELAAP